MAIQVSILPSIFFIASFFKIVVVNPHVDVNPGDYVVAKNGKGEAEELKRCGNTFVLHPLNFRYQDMEVKKGEFQIIGRVAEKEKRY